MVMMGGNLDATQTDPLIAAQESLEHDCITAGITQYRNRVQRLRQKSLESLTDPVDHLIRVYIEPFREALIRWIMESRKRPGRRAVAVPILSEMDGDVAALITLRTVLDRLSKNGTYQSVCLAIGLAVEQELRLAAFEAQNAPLYTRIQRHVQESPLGYRPDYRKRVLNHAANRYRIVWQEWSGEKRLMVGGALLDLMIQSTGLVTIEQRGGRSIRDTRLVVVPTPELEQWINKQHSRCELLSPPRQPMICPPRPYTSLNDGGYLTPTMRRPLVLRRGRVLDGEVSPASMPIVFAAVNRLQSVPWELNERVLAVATHLWDIGADLPKAASRSNIPLPEKPLDHDTNAEARALYKVRSREVFYANEAAKGRRLAVASTLLIARQMAGKTIWFPTSLDFRGRMYTTPQYLTPQGSDLAKGMLRFRRGKRLGDRGLFWLKVHTANCFGVDKVSIEDRVRWVDENLDRIRRIGADPLTENWWHDADSPFQFLAACLELAEAYSLSDPHDFVTHQVIWQDGSCNGIQHLAALSRDAEAGAYVNLIPGDRPSDIYARVAAATVATLQEIASCGPDGSSRESSSDTSSPCSCTRPESAESALASKETSCRASAHSSSCSGSRSSGRWLSISSPSLARLWLSYGVDRKIAKRPTMIVPYGGTIRAFETYIDEAITERLLEGKPHPFGADRKKAVAFLARVMWDVMGRVIPGPLAIMAWTRAVASVVSKAQQPIVWRTPSGFVVRQAYAATTPRVVKTRMGDKILKVTLAQDTDRLDPRRQARALAPNWIHSLDAAALHRTIVALGPDVDIAAVHDSYGTHACDVDHLSEVLRRSFVEMYREDVLAVFVADVAQLVGGVDKIPPPPPSGSLDIEQTLVSRYFFA